MCDTLCVLPAESANGAAMLAKNSDREPNEPHVIRYVPREEHAAGEILRCTYIGIPQASRTNAVLLLKPDWIWGAEMGINEHGVAIGNEAVFTRVKQGPDALTGMDLLRLALERASSAREAADTITRLLKSYGQGGNCGYTKDFRYDNSFLIADCTSAYILETAGENFALSQVKDKAAISNRLFTHTGHIAREGIEENGDFAARYTEPVYSYFAKGKQRRAQSLCALQNSPVTARQMARALRTHEKRFDGHEFSRGSMGSVCMHAGEFVGSNTTGSFIAVLRQNMPATVWATGASTPCIAAFKPVFFGIDAPPVFESEEEGRLYWLKRERLHRSVLAGTVDVYALRAARDALEEEWFAQEERLFSSGAPSEQALRQFALKAAAEEQELVHTFCRQDKGVARGSFGFKRYWGKENARLR